MKNERLEELKEIITNAAEERDAIIRAQKVAESRQFIGKYFKYRNSDGVNNWWLYVFVRGTDEKGNLETFRFQTDTENRTEIYFNYTHYYRFDGYEEISEAEFMKAWNALIHKINGVDFSTKR